MIGILLVGVVLRIVTLRQYTGHIDEPSSLLAIQRVSERGYPLFPSGVLYLQGAIFSYVAAPLAWFFDGNDLLDAARVLQVTLASLAIPVSMLLVHELSDSIGAALLTGCLVACDPTLIIWSVAIRPYGFLVVEVLVLMLLFCRLAKDGPHACLAGIRVTWLLPVLALLGTFTQIGFWVTIPPLALAALLTWRGRLLNTHRPILFSAAASLAPLLLFLVLGRFVGSGSGTGGGGVGGSFMGSHIFDLPHLTRMSDYEWSLWTGNFLEGDLYQFMPYLIVLVTGILIARVLAPPESTGWTTPAIAALMLVHWISIGLVILLSAPSAGTRYLTFVLPLGYVMLSLAAWCVWQLAARRDLVIRSLVRSGLVAVVVAPALLYTFTGAWWRIDFPGGNPAYWAATAWASKQMAPADILITAMPPPAYFWVGSGQSQRVYFLAGPAGGERAEQYTKTDRDGATIDYWLGITAIDSEADLCAVLRQHAGATWIVVDRARLSDPAMLGPDLEDIVLGATEERYRGANGVLVLLVLERSAWSPQVRTACGT